MGNVDNWVQQVVRNLKQTLAECRFFIIALLIKFVLQPGRLVLNKDRNHELVQVKSMTKCCTHYCDGPCEELVDKFHKIDAAILMLDDICAGLFDILMEKSIVMKRNMLLLAYTITEPNKKYCTSTVEID